MKITEIKRAKKHYYEVCFFEQSELLDIDVVVGENLKVGTDITQNQLETLKYKSNFTRAKSKALWLLEKRDYSKKEMVDKLKGDFGIDESCEAVELLCESGLIDDERFARLYANDLVEFKGLGIRNIKYELSKKGIDKELAELVCEELDIDETEAIKRIIDIKYKTYNTDEKVKRRMIAGLQRKGYSYSAIKHALNTIEENY